MPPFLNLAPLVIHYHLMPALTSSHVHDHDLRKFRVDYDAALLNICQAIRNLRAVIFYTQLKQSVTILNERNVQASAIAHELLLSLLEVQWHCCETRWLVPGPPRSSMHPRSILAQIS